MMKEGWYTDAIHNTMPVLTGARMQSFSADKDNWVISVSTEITDSSGENLGVLLMDMRYSVIEDHLRRLNLGKEGYVFLLNDKEMCIRDRRNCVTNLWTMWAWQPGNMVVRTGTATE